MGISIDMEMKDFEEAAAFLDDFGTFVNRRLPDASVQVHVSPELRQRMEVGASQPSLNGSSVASAMASIDEEVVMLPIDTPAFDIATDPGRIAFEEEG